MQRHLRRARFLAVAAGFVAPNLIAGKAQAAQFSFKLAHAEPIDQPLHVRAMQMVKAIKTETGGRLEITVFPSSQLGSQTAMLAQTRAGAIQFLALNRSIYSSIAPVAQIDSVGFAFNSTADTLRALDGPLGAYIRKDIGTKGLRVFDYSTDLGFRQITSATHPIRNADDLNGFKIRVIAARIYVDLFKTLNASPIPIDSNELYVSLQTHIVDGQETPYGTIEGYRLFEVQKYVSVSNHICAGHWMSSNPEAWSSLPADIQDVVSRNAHKYALLQRRDTALLTDSLADKLRRQGMIFNTADVNSMRTRLGPYFGRWKTEFGATAWSALEATSGRLG